MKKVWILEKFESNEMMIKTLTNLEQTFKECMNNLDEKGIASMNQTISSYKKMIAENPNGMWLGWEGKISYRQFCEVAKSALRRVPSSYKFRVIEAEIDDNAEYWCEYKIVKQNDAVLRYLMSTK